VGQGFIENIAAAQGVESLDVQHGTRGKGGRGG
jgi:hypothetical protein